MMMVAAMAFSTLSWLGGRALTFARTVVGGSTYYVSPLGSTTNDGTQDSPWPSVAFALRKAGGGNTFILEPGTYGPILVGRTYGGASGSPTVIRSQNKWEAVIDGSLHSTVEAVASEVNGAGRTTDYVIFDGLKVIHAGTDGISLGGNWNSAVNCWVTGSKGSGISAYHRNNITIQNNLIESNGSSARYTHGIYAGGSGLIVSGNVVRHNSGVGIQMSRNPRNSTISGNLVYGHQAQADILFSGSAKGATNTVTDNTLLDSIVGGIMVYGPNTIKVWSGNVIEPAVKGVSLDSISSNDVADYAKALSLILPAPATPQDQTAPTAKAFDSGLYAGKRMVLIRYSNNQPLAVPLVNQGNLLIKSDKGYNAPPQGVAYMLLKDSRTLEAMYYLTPPIGGWTSADNGTYSVFLQADQIGDPAGNVAPPGQIGQFNILLPVQPASSN